MAGSGLFDEALPVTTSMKQYRNPELFKQPLPVYFPEGQPGGSNIREDPDDPGTFLID